MNDPMSEASETNELQQNNNALAADHIKRKTKREWTPWIITAVILVIFGGVFILTAYIRPNKVHRVFLDRGGSRTVTFESRTVGKIEASINVKYGLPNPTTPISSVWLTVKTEKGTNYTSFAMPVREGGKTTMKFQAPASTPGANQHYSFDSLHIKTEEADIDHVLLSIWHEESDESPNMLNSLKKTLRKLF